MKSKYTPELDPTKCSKIIAHYDRGWYRGEHQCTRKWSVKTKDGKHYCKQHGPQAEKERGARRTSKYEYDTAIRAMGWNGCALYEALESMFDPTPGLINRVKLAKRALRSARPYYATLTKGKPK